MMELERTSSETEFEGLDAFVTNTEPRHLDEILRIESHSDNRDFVGQWSKDEHLDAISSDGHVHWVILDAVTRSVLGYVIHCDVKAENRSLWFRRIAIDSKGRGLGRAVALLSLRYCFESLKFHRIWLNVRDDNDSAFKMYKQLGFVEEGISRDVVRLLDDTFRSYVVMSMLEDEYFERYPPN